MLCASCGAPFEAEAAVCQKCGAARPNRPQPNPPAPRTRAAAVARPKITWLTKTFIAAGTTLVLLWAYVLAVAAHGEIFSARLLGYWMGSLLIPFVIAYLIGGRKNSRNSLRFSLWFVILGFTLPTLSSIGSRGWHTPSNPKAWVAARIKEAAGTVPVSQATRPADSEMEALARDAMREMLDYRKQYDAKLVAFNDGLGKLYSAESFSNAEAIQRSADSVNGVVLLDLEMSKHIQQWPDSMKARIEKSSASEAQKKAFVDGFTRSFANSDVLSARERAMQAESEWADATLDLYAFALQNRARIQVRDDQVVISNRRVRDAFNEKLQRSQALQDAVVKVNSELEQLQNTRLKDYGLSKKELGIQ